MAKNQLTKGGAGGGPGSKALGQPTQYFVGRPSTRISPAGVSQMGGSYGNHSMDSGGKKLTKSIEPVRGGALPKGGPGGVPLGSEVATNVGGGGPGKGRTLYGQGGTQGCHGAPDPGNPPPAGELFPGWPAMKR